MSIKPGSLLVFLAIGAAAGIAAALTPSTIQASTDVVTAPFEAGFGCGLCDGGCIANGHVGHTFKVDQNGTAVAGPMGTHECDPGSCEDEHPTGCGNPTFAATSTAELWQQLHEAAAADLQGLLALYDDRVTINLERHAFQLHACHGTLAGHLPMTGAQFDILAE